MDYVQMGRFNLNDSSYDGPGGNYDGVNYLDGRCYDTSVISSDNIPPFASNLPNGNKISLEVGQTMTINPEFIGPEVGQTVTSTVLTEMCGVTSNISNGTSSTASITIVGELCNVGLNTLTLQAKDNGSPQMTTTVEIQVEVLSPCEITVNTKNITVNLGTDGVATINEEDVNNNSSATCGIESLQLSKTTFNCDEIGTNQITLTVIDTEGNTKSAPADITVVDTTPPALTTKDATVILNSTGSGSITAVDVIGSENDACGIDPELTTISKTSFNCGDINSDGVTVDVTIFDNNGNYTTKQTVVTVVDNIAPVIAVPGNINEGNDPELCGASILITPPGTTDNCGVGIPEGTRSDNQPLSAIYPVGSTIITWNVTDDNGVDAIPVTQTIVVEDNEAPVITHNGNKIVTNDIEFCGAIVAVNASANDNCGVRTAVVGARSDNQPLSAIYPVGSTTITWNVTDDNGVDAIPVTQTIVVEDNEAPVIIYNGNKIVTNDIGFCGANVVVNASANDNCGVENAIAGIRSDGLALDAPFPEGSTTITWNVTDDNGVDAIPVTQTITVTNSTPIVSFNHISETPVSVKSSFVLSANFTDNNLKSAKWYFSSNGDFTDPDLAEHTFKATISDGKIEDSFNSDLNNLQLQPGVYSVKLVVTDHCEEMAEVTHDYVVIYDPDGGFVTGGGWIDSPEQAYTADESLTGRANFGFNAKYKIGKTDVDEVDGNTNFQFKAGNLHFKSSSHEDMSLVISGPKATYKGMGHINGSIETYNFLVTAIDGELTGGTDVDRFRIKIWKDGHVVYDNNIQNGNVADNADPATAISGGSIVIHKPQGGGNKTAQEQEVIAIETSEPLIEIKESMDVAPNPVQTTAVVQFSLDKNAYGGLSVYDFNGKIVSKLYNGDINADQIYEVNFDRSRLPSGNYILQLKLNNGQFFTRIVILE